MEKYSYKNNRSHSSLACILIVLGVIFILKNTGWALMLPGIGSLFAFIGDFIRETFHFIAGVGWPILLILGGIILLSKRRLGGSLILFILLLFILPHFIIIPGILLFLFFPLILIVAGIIILSKMF